MSKKKYSNDMEMKIVEEYLNGVSTSWNVTKI